VLAAVAAVRARTPLADVIVVDDGSTDDTVAIIQSHGVQYLQGAGRGPGAARNLGWRAAQTKWIWFIDSDCVAEPDALEKLLPHRGHENVAGVGGSYGNMRPDSLVASLIHEEIIERHLGMGDEVNFLATFNVLYCRAVLAEVGGFNEALKLAQDAELAFRIREAGYVLRFEKESRVKHYHLTKLWRYLRTQARQGYYRVMLYLHHPRRMGGDSYSGLVDHIQPPLAMLTLGSLMLLPWPVRWLPLGLAILLFVLQLPLTLRIVRRTGELRYLAFAPLSFLRAFARGVGMSLAVLAWLRRPRAFAGKPQHVAEPTP
jgi:cellulose synthase/poly-beta-1,6-N-acetylglucosamine synthase-like glycosyltransferase